MGHSPQPMDWISPNRFLQRLIFPDWWVNSQNDLGTKFDRLVFLDAAINGRVHVNDPVDLVFHLVENGMDIKHALHARIKRISEDGVGLQFDYFDTGVFRALQQIMSHHDDQDQLASVYS